jgi:hypothetical protein
MNIFFIALVIFPTLRKQKGSECRKGSEKERKGKEVKDGSTLDGSISKIHQFPLFLYFSLHIQIARTINTAQPQHTTGGRHGY